MLRRLQPHPVKMTGVTVRQGRTATSTEMAQLLQKSPSAIDRLLQPYRRQGRQHRAPQRDATEEPAEAVDTDTNAFRCEEGQPGFLQVDPVVHCGESTEGFYPTLPS